MTSYKLQVAGCRLKLLTFCFLIFTLSGCATYKFHHGKTPYDRGYVVSRDDFTIVEYTLGKDNTVPKLPLAKQRFKRRRDMVEDYYKRMGYIENHFKMAFWDPVTYLFKLIGGVFRLPFIAVSDYRQAHNPAYKERVRKIEDERDRKEEERIQKLKDKLTLYIQKDLAKEPAMPEPPQPAPIEVKPTAVTPPAAPVIQPQAVKPEAPAAEAVKAAPAPQEVSAPKVQAPAPETPKVEVPPPQPAPAVVNPPAKREGFIKRLLDKMESKAKPKPTKPQATGAPQAVITAKPLKGYSPLTVHFWASQSRPAKGRKIIAYSWDFGDGDTSAKPNPLNTFYSGSFQPQDFTVTLTVQDDAGSTSTATVAIQVLNK
jgi:hypothetical protein